MAIKLVGVVGSGIMGSGIAETAASSGHQVVLWSRQRKSAQAAIATVDGWLNRQVEKGNLSEDDRRAILERVTATSDFEELSGCDLVIESVVEEIGVKRELFRRLGRVCGDHTILATNTSTLPVTELAMASERPDRVCGIHFFNPAPVMPLVEIVRPLTASDDTVVAARAFAEACGKAVVEVTDRAGFVVNALLFPYLNDAVRMLDDGVAGRDDIDMAMTNGCNFPMGPLALLDLVGLDTSLSILDSIYAERPDPGVAAAPLLRRMVAAGLLGRKSGRGFYDYDDDR